jgi:hypothetical protein
MRNRLYRLSYILCKDITNREENEKGLFFSYPEMQYILCKDNTKNHMLKKILELFHEFYEKITV